MFLQHRNTTHVLSNEFHIIINIIIIIIITIIIIVFILIFNLMQGIYNYTPEKKTCFQGI
jgi:hypothetical protein